MTIPSLKQAELFKLLRDNGWSEVSNSEWENHNRIMMGNGKDSFPLQLKPVYYFPFIVKLCESLDIDAPEECKVCYEQLKKYPKDDDIRG